MTVEAGDPEIVPAGNGYAEPFRARTRSIADGFSRDDRFQILFAALEFDREAAPRRIDRPG